MPIWAEQHSARESSTQKANEAEFTSELDNLFDIAHMHADDMIKIQEDRDFLRVQRERVDVKAV